MSLYLGDIPIANDGSHNTANVDLSNLSNTGEAHFANPALTNSPYTTNRLLEIPQNLQISVNGDTITISGKATRLNGDLVNINVSRTFTGTVGKTYVLISAQLYSSMNTWTFSENNNIVSYRQDSQPTITTAYAFWFDTANNRLMFTSNTGSSWHEIVLPFGVAHYTSNGWVIDQIFNGFGYIGSTLFLLPGVKTVVPDGRNEDGTCKNHTPSTVTSVKTETISRADTAYMFTNYVSSAIAIHHYICSKTKPTVTATTLWYNPETNLPSQVLSDGTVMTPYEEIPLAKFTSDSTGKITSFEPFTVDSVLNSSLSNLSAAGKSYLAGLGMPSGRYIDLTLGASGSTYTAPANGYFVISGKPTANGGYCILDTNNYEPTYMTTNTNGWYDRGFIPVRKGQVMTLRYGNYEIEADRFKFIYAEGENS